MQIAEEEVAFYYLVGRAMQQFAHLERKLQSLACACVSPIDRPAVETAFWGIENFRSKLQFTSALVVVKFGATAKVAKDWAALEARILQASAKRNKIAHGVVNFIPHEKPGRRYGLIPWIPPVEPAPKRKSKTPAQKPKSTKQPSYAQCATNLDLARGEFHATMTAMVNFEESMRGRRAPFAKALELSPGPTAPRVLVDRIRVTFVPRD